MLSGNLDNIYPKVSELARSGSLFIPPGSMVSRLGEGLHEVFLEDFLFLSMKYLIIVKATQCSVRGCVIGMHT